MAVKPERRPAALLYAELRNFTRLSEVLQPDKVLELANEFFTFAAKNVMAGSGNVLSVQNDSLLAAFVEGEAQRFNDDALRTAQAIQRDFGPIGERWRNEYGLAAAVALGHAHAVAESDELLSAERARHAEYRFAAVQAERHGGSESVLVAPALADRSEVALDRLRRPERVVVEALRLAFHECREQRVVLHR